MTNTRSFISHGLFSGPAIERIGKSELEELVVTDTLIPVNQENALKCPKIKNVSVGLLLAEAIRRIHQKESLSVLFKHQNYVNEKAGVALKKKVCDNEEVSLKRARVA